MKWSSTVIAPKLAAEQCLVEGTQLLWKDVCARALCVVDKATQEAVAAAIPQLVSETMPHILPSLANIKVLYEKAQTDVNAAVALIQQLAVLDALILGSIAS